MCLGAGDSVVLSLASGGRPPERWAWRAPLPRPAAHLGRRPALPARDGRPVRRLRRRPGRADRDRIGPRGEPTASTEWHAGGTNRATESRQEAALNEREALTCCDVVELRGFEPLTSCM